MNKVQIMGYLDQDPEILTKRQEREKVNLILSTTMSWQDDQGHWKKQTEQHSVIVFKPSLIEWIKEGFQKGDNLFVQGSLVYEETPQRKKKTSHILVEGRWGQILRIHENDPQRNLVLAKAGVKSLIPITVEVPNEN